jgi:hypothetical protein
VIVDSISLFHYQDFIASDGGMTDETERAWKEVVMALSKYYPGFHLEGRKHKTPLRIGGILAKT